MTRPPPHLPGDLSLSLSHQPERNPALMTDPIPGYALERGPEVPRPVPFDWTMGWSKVEHARKAWADAITEVIRYEDAWALICMAPDGDLTLRDVLTTGSVWAATHAARVHVLTAREVAR